MSELLRRILSMLPVLGGVFTIVFLLLHLVPGDPVTMMLGEQARVADQEALRRQLGLHDPLLTQYMRYLAGLTQGDLGQSLREGRPVATLIAERLPATVELMLAAMGVALALAIPLGALAARFHGRLMDRCAGAIAVIGVAMPNFWLGPLLILFFSIHLNWLPVNERGDWTHLILPALTLGTALAALLSRMLRTSLVETLNEDYLRTARAKGRSAWGGLRVHALRNALIPVVTVAGLQTGALLSGAVITEQIFDWPGLGTLLLQSIANRDYPTVQGCVLVIACMYVLVHFVVDLFCVWIDPRTRQA